MNIQKLIKKKGYIMTAREEIMNLFQTYPMLTPSWVALKTKYSLRTCTTELFKMYSECLCSRDIYGHYELSKNGKTLTEKEGCGG